VVLLTICHHAVECTGLQQAPMDARARLVTDHGSGYLVEAFEEARSNRLIL